MTKKQHYMTEAERWKLEGMLQAGKSVAWIAQELGFTRQTIYNEIKRGTYMHTIAWYDVPRYSAQKGQSVKEKRQENKGRALKIGNDYEYANFLEEKILKEHYSPAAALAAARNKGFETRICVSTFYAYIENGIFLALENKHLLEKCRRKPRKKYQRKKAHEKLPSIEERPESIENREEYGHWEMDLVVGPQGSRACLLTLTERKTREEKIIRLPNRKAKTIRKAWNKLEREMPNFKQIFKSITTDNGSEFMEFEKLQKSIYGGKRFEIYYCHSYASWEKGSNENHNRIIRRFFPKGTKFEKITVQQIARVESWMNHYPRKVLGWKTPIEARAA